MVANQMHSISCTWKSLCIACAYCRLFFEDQKVAVCFVGYEPKSALTSLVGKSAWLKWPPDVFHESLLSHVTRPCSLNTFEISWGAGR